MRKLTIALLSLTIASAVAADKPRTTFPVHYRVQSLPAGDDLQVEVTAALVVYDMNKVPAVHAKGRETRMPQREHIVSAIPAKEGFRWTARHDSPGGEVAFTFPAPLVASPNGRHYTSIDFAVKFTHTATAADGTRKSMTREQTFSVPVDGDGPDGATRWLRFRGYRDGALGVAFKKSLD